ncbi:MAG TPA: hypothetical protein VFO36_08680, partial [Nitrospiraceae bacterium]|nr:hypothetical protein [Nitrospiraceae bacterium]
EALFANGEYVPLKVSGSREAHVCAFARRTQDSIAVVIAPRLYAKLLGESEQLPLGNAVWGDTTIELPPELSALEQLTNVLDGSSVRVQPRDGGLTLPAAEVLKHFPVALLFSAPARN